jgi:hypothetical protein
MTNLHIYARNSPSQTDVRAWSVEIGECPSHSLQRSCRDGKQWPDVPLTPQAHVQDEDAARHKVGCHGQGTRKTL